MSLQQNKHLVLSLNEIYMNNTTKRVPADMESLPENPPWTLFFDGPLYQEYDKFMKTKDFSKILLNTKLRLTSNLHDSKAVTAAYTLDDDHWNKEQVINKIGNTYQHVSEEDFNQKDKEDERRRARRTRAFIMLGFFIMAVLAFGTALVIHFIFITPSETRNPNHSINVSLSDNITTPTQTDKHKVEKISFNDQVEGLLHENKDNKHNHKNTGRRDGKIKEQQGKITTESPTIYASITDSTVTEPLTTEISTTKTSSSAQPLATTKTATYLLNHNPDISNTRIVSVTPELKTTKSYTSTMHINHMAFFGMDELRTSTQVMTSTASEDDSFYYYDYDTTTQPSGITSDLSTHPSPYGSKMSTNIILSNNTRNVSTLKNDVIEPSTATVEEVMKDTTEKQPYSSSSSANQISTGTILDSLATKFSSPTNTAKTESAPFLPTTTVTRIESTSANSIQMTADTISTTNILDSGGNTSTLTEYYNYVANQITEKENTRYFKAENFQSKSYFLSMYHDTKAETKTMPQVTTPNHKPYSVTGEEEKSSFSTVPDSLETKTSIPEKTSKIVKLSSISTPVLSASKETAVPNINLQGFSISTTSSSFMQDDKTSSMKFTKQRDFKLYFDTTLETTKPVSILSDERIEIISSEPTLPEKSVEMRKEEKSSKAKPVLPNSTSTEDSLPSTISMLKTLETADEIITSRSYTTTYLPNTTLMVSKMRYSLPYATKASPEVTVDKASKFRHKTSLQTILSSPNMDKVQTVLPETTINPPGTTGESMLETSTSIDEPSTSYEETTVLPESTKFLSETTTEKIILSEIDSTLSKKASSLFTPLPIIETSVSHTTHQVAKSTASLSNLLSTLSEATTTTFPEATTSSPSNQISESIFIETTSNLSGNSVGSFHTATKSTLATNTLFHEITTKFSEAILPKTTTVFPEKTKLLENIRFPETTTAYPEISTPLETTKFLETTTAYPETTTNLLKTTTMILETTTTLPEVTTLPENYNTVEMSDVTSYTFDKAKLLCSVRHAVKWQSLSVKVSQTWRPLEVTLFPSGQIKWSRAKRNRHTVTFAIHNSTDGTGSNMTLSLILNDVQCRDANDYICSLKSSIEDKTARSRLTVVGKPSKKISLTLGPSVIEDRAFRITASWQGGYPIPWANMSWIALDANNKSYNLADYGEYRDYELHEDHKFCQTTLKHSIVVFPRIHLNDTTVIVKPNINTKRYFVDKSMEKYLEQVQPGQDKILVIPLNYCKSGKKEIRVPHPYAPCKKFVRCLTGDMVIQQCPRGTCFYEGKQECG